jgi:hypothetical protein
VSGGTRTLIGTALGLAMMQLILSTSQDGGRSGALLSGAFQLPAKWLRSFIDPSKPGIPAAAKSTASASKTDSSLASGLSGKATTTGTGSNVMNV